MLTFKLITLAVLLIGLLFMYLGYLRKGPSAVAFTLLGGVLAASAAVASLTAGLLS